MRFSKRDVYLYQFEHMSFIERLYFIIANLKPSFGYEFKLNPLKWCLMDLIMITWYSIAALILTIVLIPMSIYDAVILKNKYSNYEDKNCIFISNARVLEL